MKLRECNVLNCSGIMRPTRELVTFGGKIELDRAHLRFFVCTVCGNKNTWVDKPIMDGSAAELHCIGLNMWCCASMSSDKHFTLALRRMPDGALKRLSRNKGD